MSRRGLLVAATALLSLAGGPRGAHAQTRPAPPAAAPALDPKLVELAKLHVAMNQARDDFFAKIARTHDDAGKANLRKEFNRRVAEILGQHGTTQQEYQRMIFVISSDSAQRAQFDKALRQVAEAAPL